MKSRHHQNKQGKTPVACEGPPSRFVCCIFNLSVGCARLSYFKKPLLPRAHSLPLGRLAPLGCVILKLSPSVCFLALHLALLLSPHSSSHSSLKSRHPFPLPATPLGSLLTRTQTSPKLSTVQTSSLLSPLYFIFFFFAPLQFFFFLLKADHKTLK